MNLTDIVDQLKDRGKMTWDKIQESAAYQQAIEKYEDLPAAQQRLVRLGGGLLLVLFLLSPPISTLLSSQEAVEEFNRKRDLTRELLRVIRDASNAPNIPQAPDLFTLQSRIQQELQQRDKLMPEQISSIQAANDSGQIIPKNLTLGSLSVNLQNLNLRQILDIAYRMATVSPSVKMTDIEITASSDKPGYLHFTSKVVALKAPEPPKFEPEPIPKKNSDKGRSGEESPEGEE